MVTKAEMDKRLLPEYSDLIYVLRCVLGAAVILTEDVTSENYIYLVKKAALLTFPPKITIGEK